MSRRGRRAAAPERAGPGWRDRVLLALAVLAATCLGIVWAGGGWRTGLVIGAGAAVVVVGAFALGSTMPSPPRDDEQRDEEQRDDDER